MKRFKLFAVVLTLVLSIGLLSACTKKTAENTNTTTPPANTQTQTETPTTTYKDGVYQGSYDKFDTHGWKAQIEIEIKDDKIANVTFDYINADGKLKSEDADYKTNMEKVTKTYPAKFIPELQQKLIDTQDITKVDAVTGATSSSNDFKTLAAFVIDEMAKKGDTTPKTMPLPAGE